MVANAKEIPRKNAATYRRDIEESGKKNSKILLSREFLGSKAAVRAAPPQIAILLIG
jgi:hypothetical protein